MNIFCTILNTALKAKFLYTFLPLKKKYVNILYVLQQFSCINYFIISKRHIKVFFRYAFDRPLFFLTLKSTIGNKLYYKKNFFLKNMYLKGFNLKIFSSDKIVSTVNVLHFLGFGGKYILEVNLFTKK
jgi:hypothetical protein